MPKTNDNKRIHPQLTRRDAFTAAGVCFAMLSNRAFGRADKPSPSGASLAANRKPTFAKDNAADGAVEINLHGGNGTAKVKFFVFDNAPWPAHFLIYDLPPGASEGVHSHFSDNRNNQGSFDEYYHILSGQGQMEIEGNIVPVVEGDHIHTPLEVAHGIENTHPTRNLRVFLTFIQRGGEKPPFSVRADGA